MSESNSTVEYRDIKGFPGYRVGSDGSVWTCRRQGWRVLKPRGCQRWGHLRVRLEPGHNYKLIHRLVLEAFVGPCPPGMQCRHFPDRDPTNNYLSNLQWGTSKENHEDAIKHGTTTRGEKSAISKLNEAKVNAIRKEHAGLRCGRGRLPNGALQALAAKYGVTASAISHVVQRHTWKHLTGHGA